MVMTTPSRELIPMPVTVTGIDGASGVKSRFMGLISVRGAIVAENGRTLQLVHAFGPRGWLHHPLNHARQAIGFDG